MRSLHSCGSVLVVGRGQRDVAVLHEVDDHPPRRFVGRGGDEHRLADLEQGDAHAVLHRHADAALCHEP